MLPDGRCHDSPQLRRAIGHICSGHSGAPITTSGEGDVREIQIHSAAAGQSAGDRRPDRDMLLVPLAQVRKPGGRTRRPCGRRPHDASPNPGAARRPPPACCSRFRSRPRAWSSSRSWPDANQRNGGRAQRALRAAGYAEGERRVSALTTRTRGPLSRRRCTPRSVQIDGRVPEPRTSRTCCRPEAGREVKWSEARLLVLNSESRALRARRRPRGRRRAIRRWPPMRVCADRRRHLRRRLPAAGAARASHSVSPEAHARRAAASSASCRWRARRTIVTQLRPGRIRSSRARRRRSIRRSARTDSTRAGRCSRSTATSARAGTTTKCDAGMPAEAAFARKRRGRDVLRARGRLPAQLPRGALRGAAHRDHLPDVLPAGST